MSPKRLPDDIYAGLLAEAETFTREGVLRDGRFWKNDLSAHLARLLGTNGQRNIGPTVVERLMTDLDAEYLGHKQGYSRRAIPRIRPATLADLVDLARQSVDASFTPPTGRRPTREVAAITAVQLGALLTAAGVVAEMITGDRRGLAAVGPEHFAWIPTAGEKGQGEWSLVERVGDYSDETAKRDYSGKRTVGDLPWHRSMNASRRKAHVAGVRILLDLAVTKGRLARGEALEDCARATRRAAEWQPWTEEWTARLTREIGKSIRKIKQGIECLHLYATRQGALSPDETDWKGVRDAIERDAQRQSDPITNDVRTWAAYSYRALLERGMIVGPEWPKQLEERMSLVHTSLAKQTAKTGDFSRWVDDSGCRPTVLCAVLTDWQRWATLPQDRLEQAHAAGELPLRRWSNPTSEQRLRVASDDQIFRLDKASVKNRLDNFNLHAGYCARHLGVDFASDPEADLALVDPEGLKAHLRDRNPGKSEPKDTVVTAMAWAMATLASPYLEAQALLRRDCALRKGDLATASSLEEKAARLRESAVELQSVALRATSSKGMRGADGAELTRKQIQKIWQLWSHDGVSGWHKLGLMRDAMVAEIERLGARLSPDAQANGVLALSVTDQVAAIEAGRFHPTMTWAVLVRDAVLVTLLWKIPLRERNVVEMTFDNLRLLGEGAMHLEYSADEMKSDRAFEPKLLGSDELNDPDAVAMLLPDLWKLFLVSGGARDEVLRLVRDSDVTVREWSERQDDREAGRRRSVLVPRWRILAADDTSAPTAAERDRRLRAGDVAPSRYVFPALARKGGGHGVSNDTRIRGELAFNADSFAQQWKNRIREYSQDMQIDPDALDAYFGAIAPHIVRLLFGSHHANPDRWPDALGLEDASTLLHHASSDITKARYVAKNERDTSAVSRREVSAPAVATPAAGHGYADEMRHAVEMRTSGMYSDAEFAAVKASLNAKHAVATAA